MDSIREPPAAAIAVEFKLTREELVPVLRWRLLKNVQIRIGIVMGALFMLVGVIILAVPGGSAKGGGTTLAIGAFYAGLYVWVMMRGSIRAAKKTVEKAHGPTKLEFTDDAVHVHTELSDAVNRWAVYTETLQHGDMYLLRIGKGRVYTFVPKRAFRSTYEEIEFRRLVTRHTSAHLEDSH